jgi:hypothetical protein
MKTAIKILVIIGVIIGIIWSLFGFFGAGVFLGIEKGLTGEIAQERQSKYEDVGVRSAFALMVIIVGLVFGIIASVKTSGKTTTIVMGVLLGGSGVIATILYSYVAGPIYSLGGLLAIIAGLVQKQKVLE